MSIRSQIGSVMHKKIFTTYQRVYNKERPWVITSYITLPYYFRWFRPYMLAHQNREGSLIIREAFRELGLNFLAVSSKKENVREYIDSSKVKIVFGIEPNFVNFSKLYPKVTKVYFATGAYYKHQNDMIIKRTNEVNRKKHCSLQYSRLVSEHESVKIADWIIQIGSKYTLETYPEEVHQKIRIVRQNTFEFLRYDEKIKTKNFDPRTFLWFGSTGAVLKGLDLVLDFFAKNNQYTLHVVGPVEKDFQQVYENELFHTQNIYFHGPLNINSRQLLKIAGEASFVVLPSASEGCPGSVLNMMRLGMVPIVSKYAAFDSIENFGFVTNDLSVEGLSKAIDEASKMTRQELLRAFAVNSEFVTSNFNSLTFLNDLKESFQQFLGSKFCKKAKEMQ